MFRIEGSGTWNFAARCSTKEYQMETSDQYLKYADDCDRMSKEMPAHAETLKVIADAWRSLATEAEHKIKAPPLGSVT